VRRAWIILGSLFTVIALAWTTLNGVALLAHQETTEQHSWDAAGITTIEIHNGAGDVRVTGADTDRIELDSQITRGLFDTVHTERIVGDRLVITTDCPEAINHYCSVTQELAVPSDLAVVIVSHDGDTFVADIAGPVDIISEDGRVELSGLRGTLRLGQEHGSAIGTRLESPDVNINTKFGHVSLSFTQPPRSTVVDADFGDVEIVVPDDGRSYAVTSTTAFGETDNQLRSDPRSDLRIEVDTQFGRATLRYGA
jgi:hypothetical protein